MVPEIGRFRVNSAESTRNRTGPSRVLPEFHACASFSAKLGWTVFDSAEFSDFPAESAELHRVLSELQRVEPSFKPTYTESEFSSKIWVEKWWIGRVKQVCTNSREILTFWVDCLPDSAFFLFNLVLLTSRGKGERVKKKKWNFELETRNERNNIWFCLIRGPHSHVIIS